MYILWIRHGFSCSNFLSATDPFYMISGPLESDAKLTGVGKRQAKKAGTEIIKKVKTYKKRGKKLRVIPTLFSSILSRAIQTSDNINKGMTKTKGMRKFPIIITPFIEEIPLSIYFPIDRQNQPQNFYHVRDELDIDFNVFSKLNPYDRHGNPILRVNVKKFYKIALPLIVEYLEENRYIVNSQTTIVLVSHRKTIEEATGLSLGNVGGVLQNIKKEDKNSWNPGKSEIIFEGYTIEESLENLKENDINSCECSKIN